MQETKKQIYNILTQVVLDDVDIFVSQDRPEVIESFPAITFFISSNIPDYSLEKTLEYENIEVTVDVWAKTSVQSGALLSALEETMRENDWRMVFSSDVPDPEGYSHITTLFNLSI